jgi:hypothetical protein
VTPCDRGVPNERRSRPRSAWFCGDLSHDDDAEIRDPADLGQQAQPEITHNHDGGAAAGARRRCDRSAQRRQASPSDGDCYIVGALPTGAFTGHAHAIAVYFAGWNFIPGYDNDGVIIPMTSAQNGLSIFNNSPASSGPGKPRAGWWSPAAPAPRADRSARRDGERDRTENGDYLVWNDAAGKWVNQNPPRLVDLSDVAASETGTIDGDFLAWDDGLQKWVPRPISISSDGVPALSDLSDVAVGDTSTQDGDFLSWDESLGKWVATPINFPSESGVPNLSELPDVSIVSPIDGDVLTYNGITHKWNAEPGGSPLTSSGADTTTAKAFSVYLNVAQNIADATYATVLFDTVQEDPWHWYNAATGRFTPKKKGLWCFFGGFQGDTASALAYVIEKLRKNGVDLVASAFGPIPALPTLSNECFAQVVTRMNGTTDYVDMQGYVTGTGGSNHVRAGTQTFFGGFFIGD